jgi:hypothetical protein
MLLFDIVLLFVVKCDVVEEQEDYNKWQVFIPRRPSTQRLQRLFTTRHPSVDGATTTALTLSYMIGYCEKQTS